VKAVGWSRVLRFVVSIPVAFALVSLLTTLGADSGGPCGGVNSLNSQQLQCGGGGGGGGGGGPTHTAVPTATNTPVPTPTNTAVPTSTPLPPIADAGWSSASWGGPPQANGNGTAQQMPNSAYVFGIVGADWGAYCTGSTNPHLLTAIQNMMSSGRYFSVFWFVVGVDWAHDNCQYNLSAASQWGIDQADRFANVLDATFQQAPSGSLTEMAAAFADIEGVGGYWMMDPRNPVTYQPDIDTISNFMAELCRRGYCSNGIYTSESQWTAIVGDYSGSPTPNFNTTRIWLANQGPPSIASLNTTQHYFDQSPGGFSIYSWQYASDYCQPSNARLPCSSQGAGWAYSNDSPSAPISQGYDCHLTFSNAQYDAENASPPIPRFDKWTNTEPESLCNPPPIQF
jgi:hypothetical protein